jgi:hypothetical protein
MAHGKKKGMKPKGIRVDETQAGGKALAVLVRFNGDDRQ